MSCGRSCNTLRTSEIALSKSPTNLVKPFMHMTQKPVNRCDVTPSTLPRCLQRSVTTLFTNKSCSDVETMLRHHDLDLLGLPIIKFWNMYLPRRACRSTNALENEAGFSIKYILDEWTFSTMPCRACTHLMLLVPCGSPLGMLSATRCECTHLVVSTRRLLLLSGPHLCWPGGHGY